MQKHSKYTTKKKGTVKSTVLDVQPKPQKDDPEEPSHWDRNPEGQVLNNVPVKFVMADGREEVKNVSIQFERDGEHFQVVGGLGVAGSLPVSSRPLPRGGYTPVGKVNPALQSTLLDVQPKIQKDQPEDTKKWERFPNLAHQNRGVRRHMVQQKPWDDRMPKGLPPQNLVDRRVPTQRPRQRQVVVAPQQVQQRATPQRRQTVQATTPQKVSSKGKLVYTPGQRNVRFHN